MPLRHTGSTKRGVGWTHRPTQSTAFVLLLLAPLGCGDPEPADFGGDDSTGGEMALEGPEFMEQFVVETYSRPANSPISAFVTSSSETATVCIYDDELRFVSDVAVEPRQVNLVDRSDFPSPFIPLAASASACADSIAEGDVPFDGRVEDSEVAFVAHLASGGRTLVHKAALGLEPIGVFANLSSQGVHVCYRDSPDDGLTGVSKSTRLDFETVLEASIDRQFPESWIVPADSDATGQVCWTHTRWLDAGPTLDLSDFVGNADPDGGLFVVSMFEPE